MSDLGIGENDNDAYLMKLPSRLATAWSEAPDGTLLAEIVLGGSTPVLEVRQGAGATKIYEIGKLQDASELNLRPYNKTTREIRRETEDGDLIIEQKTTGRVLSGRPRVVVGLTPHTGKAYRRDCRSRMIESLQSSHIVQAIQPSEVDASREISRINAENMRNKRALEEEDDGNSNKKVKISIDRNLLKSHIFRLLAGKPEDDLLTYKDLFSAIAKDIQHAPPEHLLKDVLTEICRKIHKPGRIVLYSLKPEYQRSSTT
uniref:Transcription initiation factor IIF subunit beta n=1 Tax=Aureoumbra lagunensis TaxID=44058 RepID=A0A7S3K2P0_9STRA|mmetsp:Transcript_16560/g.24877  ORF Transcript_16560/g.24877 Transcript_16560/m.24877 type:complete len:259 (+) Transcript_16560:60-836(+)